MVNLSSVPFVQCPFHLHRDVGLVALGAVADGVAAGSGSDSAALVPLVEFLHYPWGF